MKDKEIERILDAVHVIAGFMATLEKMHIIPEHTQAFHNILDDLYIIEWELDDLKLLNIRSCSDAAQDLLKTINNIAPELLR